MASFTYLREKENERKSRASKGGDAKFRNHCEVGGKLEVVGGLTTFGSLGEHRIEVLACEDPTHFWVRVDGKMRCPRTERGFKATVSQWLFKASKEGRYTKSKNKTFALHSHE